MAGEGLRPIAEGRPSRSRQLCSLKQMAAVAIVSGAEACSEDPAREEAANRP